MTAMRRGDILSLRMDAITDDGISVRQGKTGKRQLIEWTSALKECVERLKALGPPLRPTLVCTKRGRQYTAKGFSRQWHWLMGKAVAQGVTRFTFHDIRARSLTSAEQQGLDPQRLAGHTTAQQTATYLRSKTIDRIQPVRVKV
ncbi:MAG TPA: tyrosine-type recombinase/integrase [Gammaproteobacteria bacterium]|nr:tyrosine-type recombinase/integrase [Gammaproteobacteria bacterium]